MERTHRDLVRKHVQLLLGVTGGIALTNLSKTPDECRAARLAGDDLGHVRHLGNERPEFRFGLWMLCLFAEQVLRQGDQFSVRHAFLLTQTPLRRGIVPPAVDLLVSERRLDI